MEYWMQLAKIVRILSENYIQYLGENKSVFERMVFTLCPGQLHPFPLKVNIDRPL